MLKYVHHVHYLVHDRDAMVAYMEKVFGMKPDFVTDDLDNDRKEALYDIDKTHIQITQPTSETTAMGKHLKQHGPGVFHVAWAVSDLPGTSKELSSRGAKVGGLQPSPRGYMVSNIDPATSHGIWFQFAEGDSGPSGTVLTK